MIEYLMERYPDMFFYMLYPEQCQEDEVEMAFLNRHSDRVQLIAKTANLRDRLVELCTLGKDMYEILGTHSPYWDADVVVTSRIPQLANMRALFSRMWAFRKGTIRGFVGLEEMPMLKCRKTVPWSEKLGPVVATHYNSADYVIMNNTWTKDLFLKGEAKDTFTPTIRKDLGNNISEAVPVKLGRLDTGKTKSYEPGEDFYVGFTGRVTGTRNFKDVAKLFRKLYEYPLGENRANVKFVISTQSQSFGSANVGEIGFIEVEHNSREEFYKFLEEKVHIVVNLSTVEDFSLSTYEPLKFGVPVIVPNRPWADFLGQQYPFRCNDFVKVYGMLKSIIGNYNGWMGTFKKWESVAWASRIKKSFNRTTSELFADWLDVFVKDVREYHREHQGNTLFEMAEQIIKSDLKEVNLVEFLRGEGKTIQEDLIITPVMKRPVHLGIKQILEMAGFRDTNEPSVMRRD